MPASRAGDSMTKSASVVPRVHALMRKLRLVRGDVTDSSMRAMLVVARNKSSMRRMTSSAEGGVGAAGGLGAGVGAAASTADTTTTARVHSIRSAQSMRCATGSVVTTRRASHFLRASARPRTAC